MKTIKYLTAFALATTEFGGRKWTAWFSTDLPFQDGPYKFYGLPGLIVKIEDEAKDYSWVLQANKKVSDYNEKTYMEQTFMPNATVAELSKEKFDKTFNEYKKDPFGSALQLDAIFRRAIHVRIHLYYLRRIKNNAHAPIIGAIAIDIKDIW